MSTYNISHPGLSFQQEMSLPFQSIARVDISYAGRSSLLEVSSGGFKVRESRQKSPRTALCDRSVSRRFQSIAKVNKENPRRSSMFMSYRQDHVDSDDTMVDWSAVTPFYSFGIVAAGCWR